MLSDGAVVLSNDGVVGVKTQLISTSTFTLPQLQPGDEFRLGSVSMVVEEMQFEQLIECETLERESEVESN